MIRLLVWLPRDYLLGIPVLVLKLVTSGLVILVLVWLSWCLFGWLEILLGIPYLVLKLVTSGLVTWSWFGLAELMFCLLRFLI